MAARLKHSIGLALAVALAAPLGAVAQQMPYGPGIGVDVARKAASAAVAEGKKNGWTVAVAIVDPGGHLVYFERIDGTQVGSSRVSVEKARSAVEFKRPTKAFEDGIAQGRLGILSLSGAVPLEGGVPLVVDGKIVGAIGVSGANSQQDGVCANAGLAALGPPPAPAAEKK
jgi:uncharacterized protein GlcG (DUF336 family)